MKWLLNMLRKLLTFATLAVAVVFCPAAAAIIDR